MGNQTVTVRGRQYTVDTETSDTYLTVAFQYIEGGYKGDITDKAFVRAIQVMVPDIPESLMSDRKIVLNAAELTDLVRELIVILRVKKEIEAIEENEPLNDDKADRSNAPQDLRLLKEIVDNPPAMFSTPTEAANIGVDSDEVAELKAELERLKKKNN